jgi:putative flippase GtrA
MQKRPVRYVLAGGLSYAIELSCLLALHNLGHFSVEAATAISFWVGIVTSFLFQKLLAFQDYQKTINTITHQVVGYGLLVGFNYVFTLVIVALFPANLIVFSRTLALLIVTIWNYLFYKIIFNEKPRKATKHLLEKAQRTSVYRFISRKTVLAIILTLPIIFFFYQYVFTGSRILAGDFDYYAQMYDAFRLSVVHYHQIPLWNPWMSGGLPLFTNPQFGLFSLQSLLVLPFGAVYGLKLAYVIYAISGFWGMYLLCRRVLTASKFRSLLLSYIWIFGGFFAGHNISHFTFTLFFLTPWLFYLLARMEKRWNWLWFGLLEALIILSSVHYAFLMTAFVTVCYVVLAALGKYVKASEKLYSDNLPSTRDLAFFCLKSLGVAVLISGYRLFTTFYTVNQNPKFPATLIDYPNHIRTLVEALFIPIGHYGLNVPANLQWGWGEYSMYLGIGFSLAFILCVAMFVLNLIRGKNVRQLISNPFFVAVILLIGIISFAVALGNHSSHSPYHLLRLLPGFSQTRVAARWQIFVVFSMIVFVAGWRRYYRFINILLLASVVELFIAFGPPAAAGANQTKLPTARFNDKFSQYDNNFKHLDAAQNPNHSYYYSTEKNVGQIFGDDSMVDTLDKVYSTARCGSNIHPACDFVLSKNAKLLYWSPNKIILQRTGNGNIELNMNVDRGWQINGEYPFAHLRGVDPSRHFIIHDRGKNYTLRYAPKFSISWFTWRIERI